MSMEKRKADAINALKTSSESVETVACDLAAQLGYDDADAVLESLPEAGMEPVGFVSQEFVAAFRKNTDADPSPDYVGEIEKMIDWLRAYVPIDRTTEFAIKPKMVEAYWGMMQTCVDSALESRPSSASVHH